jgi:hypothetical protein
MNIKTKHIFLIIGSLIIIGLIWVFIARQDSPEKDVKVVKELETQVLPFIKESNVTFFFDEDWCHVLEYNNRLVSQTIESTSLEDCGKRLTGKSNPESYRNRSQDVSASSRYSQ